MRSASAGVSPDAVRQPFPPVRRRSARPASDRSKAAWAPRRSYSSNEWSSSTSSSPTGVSRYPSSATANTSISTRYFSSAPSVRASVPLRRASSAGSRTPW
ncbi:hypothetical protein WKI68_04160 [Streptomyces sp. MS1.HAVA.3]|uniref:Uncharacterized protein n=1 Tax=Streptomyces caledonius TaxID=3134107 RepID=A0ABU8TZ41_9ACTN